MPNLKTIKIFLSSSGELKQERKEIALFISQKNTTLVKQNIFLELVLWEEKLLSFRGERIQDYFNEEMLKCDVFIALFYKKVGQFTKEEFDIAYKSLKNGRNPKYMFVFFKEANIPMNEITENYLAVVKFKNDIEKAEQIYATFNSTEDLLLKFQRQLEQVIPDQQMIKIPLQLPLQVEHFTDREKELSKLIKDLKPGNVITLCGPGGIGKSALASKAIWELVTKNRQNEKFPDGILWHDFYTNPNTQHALEHFALSFGEEARPTPEIAAKRALSGKRILVLLDGAEDADDLPLILNILGNSCVLVTTRKKKDAVSQRDDMQSLPTDEAVKLFQAWSNTDDIESVHKICELTGGLPLAVRLAGRYIFETGDSIKEYLSDLENTTLDALDQGERKLESVPVLLKRSLNQISDDAVNILGIAGILAFASFSKDVIQAAMPDVNIKKPINVLIGYGLLNRANERLIISHALIHTYARKNHKPDDDIVESVAGYYYSCAEEHAKLGPKGYALLDVERAHIMRLMEECKAREIWQWVNDLVWAVAAHQSYFEMCGYSIDRKDALKYGLEASQKLYNKEDEASHLGALGNVYKMLGKVDKAIECYEKSLAISREVKNFLEESHMLSNIGILCKDFGQIDKAIEYYEQALFISKKIGYRKGEESALGNLGNAYRNLGQIDKAIKYLKQALYISREIGHQQGESNHLGNIGNAYYTLGDFNNAIEYLEQALVISKELGYKMNEGSWLNNIGNAYKDSGEIEKAIECYEQALDISREIGHRQGESSRLGNLGLVYRIVGQIDKAIRYLKQALDISREIGHWQGVGNHLCNLGTTYYSLGQLDKALPYFQESLNIFEQINSPNAEQLRRWLNGLHLNLG